MRILELEFFSTQAGCYAPGGSFQPYFTRKITIHVFNNDVTLAFEPISNVMELTSDFPTDNSYLLQRKKDSTNLENPRYRQRLLSLFSTGPKYFQFSLFYKLVHPFSINLSNFLQERISKILETSTNTCGRWQTESESQVCNSAGIRIRVTDQLNFVHVYF